MLSPASIIDDSSSRGHGAFLYRAAHDAQFRAVLETDPQAALSEFGLDLDPEQIPSKVAIPSAEGILDALIDVEESNPKDSRKIPWAPFIE